MIIPDLAALVAVVRTMAQQEIMSRFAVEGFSVKADGSLVTEADLAMDRRLRDYLQQYWPETAFLSEEMEPAQQEALLRESDSLWCLDPLDGTSNFAAGVPLFAVSLALFCRGEVVLAITYDPVRDEAFTAQKGKGAWLNGKMMRCAPSHFPMKNAVAMVDFKRLSVPIKQLLIERAPYGSQRNLGSCALEWAWMAANRGQLYLHGGMKLWDLAAGTLLLSEAGGFACTLEGESVFRPAMSKRSVVISPDQRLFEEWLHFLQSGSGLGVDHGPKSSGVK